MDLLLKVQAQMVVTSNCGGTSVKEKGVSSSMRAKPTVEKGNTKKSVAQHHERDRGERRVGDRGQSGGRKRKEDIPRNKKILWDEMAGGEVEKKVQGYGGQTKKHDRQKAPRFQSKGGKIGQHPGLIPARPSKKTTKG